MNFIDNNIVLQCHKNKKLCMCVSVSVCVSLCVYIHECVVCVCVCLCGSNGGSVITRGALSWNPWNLMYDPRKFYFLHYSLRKPKGWPHVPCFPHYSWLEQGQRPYLDHPKARVVVLKAFL